MQLRDVPIRRQVPVPIPYTAITLATPLKLDLLVDDRVIVECKTVVHYHTIFKTQLLTYLRLTERKLGVVINFGERLLKDGIHRVVSGL